MIVECPQCHKKIEYSSANPYRPFCSERCKKIDLGAWAEESYVITSTPPEPDELPDENQ
jgi:endogenous inhibitor of DNA gyrase (YacG/DUF329 family)